MESFLVALWLSCKLAFVSSALLSVICIPLGLWLVYPSRWWKEALFLVLSLPMILPPTVIGFYLLLLFGKGGLLAPFHFAFTFQGMVIGMTIFSLPFFLQTWVYALKRMQSWYYEVFFLEGGKWIGLLCYICVPAFILDMIGGFILAFIHGIGEFGMVFMVGGAIAGETKTASIAIFEKVALLDYKAAHLYSFILILTTFTLLIIVKLLFEKRKIQTI